jgi:hypothetical protein
MSSGIQKVADWRHVNSLYNMTKSMRRRNETVEVKMRS